VGRAVDLYADRHGRRRATILLLGSEGVLASLFALVDGFAAFIVVACAASIAERACAAAAGTLIAEEFGAAKVECRAALQAAINGGLCVGGLVGALALATGSGAALRAIAVANGASYLIACVLTSRLPASRSPQPSTRDAAPGSECNASARRGRVPARYAAFGAANGLMTIHDALLPVALPLWVAGSHLVPAWSVGGALFLNSVLVGVLQLPASRRVGGDSAARDAALIAGGLLAVACAVVVGIQYVPGGAQLVALALAVAVYTVAELAHASCAIYLSYSLAEPADLSACQSYLSSTVGVAKALGPVTVVAAVAAGPVGLLALGVGLAVAGAGVARTATGGWRRGHARFAPADEVRAPTKSWATATR
jgi:hypothetical protein